jgi:cysteine-rich repeat protein
MLACNGNAQKLRLICSGGVWAQNGQCGENDNCNSATGACSPILPGCVGRTAGFAYCDFASPAPAYQDVRKTCGPDLVTNATTETCTGICSGGICQGTVCGDGKVGSGEGCDDGNAVALDGCEPVTAFPASARCQPSQVLKVSAGDGHTCALCRGGYVRCWGENTNGELGLGHQTVMNNRHPFQATTSSGAPGMVSFGGTAAIDIDAGYGFTCAILNGGSVRCWGKNDVGQLGLGNTTPMPTVVGAAVNLGGSTATAISAGNGFACATLASGATRCWGNNGLALLGQGNADPAILIANVVFGGLTATSVSAGTDTGCALIGGNAVRCWGDNSLGEFGLGNSATLPNSGATAPSGYANATLAAGRTATSVTVGTGFVCARLDDATAECWGFNNVGQLGLGHTNSIGDNEVPGSVGVLTTGAGVSVAAIDGGAQFTCALLGGSVGLKCWGNNQKGQLGQGNTTRLGNTAGTVPSQITAIRFPTGASPSAVSTGNAHVCALATNGSVRCWGWNNRGQLGLGTVSSGTPDFVGGTSAETPDQIAAIRIFQ